MDVQGYQQDVFPDQDDVRRDDFEVWAKGYWPHLHGREPDFTRHADGYRDHELHRYWHGWRMHVNWLRYGEGGEDRGRDHLREMLHAHVEERLAKAASERAPDYSLGYLHGQMIAFAMAGVVTKDQWEGYQDRLDALGLGSRMPGWRVGRD
ncbi:hypothetical protein ACNSPR_28000 [Klebsiella pneumoniae]